MLDSSIVRIDSSLRDTLAACVFSHGHATAAMSCGHECAMVCYDRLDGFISDRPSYLSCCLDCQQQCLYDIEHRDDGGYSNTTLACSLVMLMTVLGMYLAVRSRKHPTVHHQPHRRRTRITLVR
jgi:hypothetical protein